MVFPKRYTSPPRRTRLCWATAIAGELVGDDGGGHFVAIGTANADIAGAKRAATPPHRGRGGQVRRHRQVQKMMVNPTVAPRAEGDRSGQAQNAAVAAMSTKALMAPP